MYEPIEVPTSRTGARSSVSINSRGIGHHGCRCETVSIRRCADSPVVERDDAVASCTECRHLVNIPRASNTALARDEQNGSPPPRSAKAKVTTVGRYYGAGNVATVPIESL